MSGSNTLPLFKVVGFVGHRELANPAAVAEVIGRELDALQGVPGAEWQALSSIAAGGDRLFVQEVLARQLGWEAVLPLAPSEFRKDFDEAGWREVEALLAEAEHTRVIGARSDRNDSYLDCGVEIAADCDVLIAVWDGQPARGRGGTAEIVAYSRELGRPLLVIDPATLTVRRENSDRLHEDDGFLAYFNGLPEVPDGSGDSDGDAAFATVRAFQRKLDHAATSHAPHFRRLITLTVGLHVLATALAAAGLALALHDKILPWGKLLCLLAALVVAGIIRRHRDQHDWARCRLGAEMTRSALATWGMRKAERLFDEVDWAGLEPLHRSLNTLHRRSAQQFPVSFDTFKQRYLRERIGGQLDYFARHEKRAGPALTRLRAGFLICSALAILCAASYAIFSLTSVEGVPAWVEGWIFGLGPIVFPVLAAGCISLISIYDLHRRAARYREMRIRLEAARREASFAPTWASLENAVIKVERALLQEVLEWHSITSFSESH